MPSIKIAANYITLVPTTGHLQIIFDDDNPSTPLVEAEVQIPSSLLAGDWNFNTFGRPHGANTPYIADDDTVEDADRYVRTEALTLEPYQTAENVWSMLRSVHNALAASAPDLDYDTFQNSNSYVRTALYAVGIDLSDYLTAVTPNDVFGFPGKDKNVLLDPNRGVIFGNAPVDMNLSGANSGTAGADFIRTGTGNDTIDGKAGDDVITGGRGNDILTGGEGIDTAIYEGASSEYIIEFLPDNSVKINDSVIDRNGIDTLNDVDIAQFSDKDIKLSPGQDIAFVIDTTGSMFDDIAAVKAQSSEIINAIFDGENSVLDSRIAIVGYNDPGTNTYLSFTDQPNINDRKAAALNGINSVTVGGGGDFPEMVNSGLIRALNGSAGSWREEASARRIILFGDAPPKDTDLRAQVLELASDVGVTIESNIASLKISEDITNSTITDGLALTSFMVTAEAADGTEVKIPVEIFTILIGNDSTTRTDFESLTTATGGKSFNVANASEIVDALIAVITAPDNVSPVAQDDSVTTRQETAVNISVLSNDSDPDGDILSIESFTQGANGLVTLNDNGTIDDILDDFLIYTPIKQLNPKIGFNDSFEYTISDGNGGIVTSTVNVAVGKIENGGNGKNTIFGTPGDDVLSGGNGKDKLYGAAGNDLLQGDKGSDLLFGDSGNDILRGGLSKDTLNGGLGNDTLYSDKNDKDILTGGNDLDVFVFTKGSKAVITDFEPGIDKIDLIALGLTSVNKILKNAEYDAKENTLELEIGNKSAKVEIELIGLNLGQLVTSDFLI